MQIYRRSFLKLAAVPLAASAIDAGKPTPPTRRLPRPPRIAERTRAGWASARNAVISKIILSLTTPRVRLPTGTVVPRNGYAI